MKLQVSIVAFALCVLATLFACPSQAQAQDYPTSRIANGGEPNWYPFVIARGADRLAIQSTPMTERPYRPMHFYGNAIRRSYFRGSLAPMPRDIVRGASSFLLRR